MRIMWNYEVSKTLGKTEQTENVIKKRNKMQKNPLLTLLLISCLSPLFMSCSDTSKLNVSWTEKASEKTSSPSRPVLNVYVESSGSMNGYTNDGSEFKDAIYSYVSTLDSYIDKTNLNFINTEVLPYKGDVDKFIGMINGAGFKKAGGDTSKSDIADMFKMILSKTGEDTVSIFVSDCILDVPEGAAKDFFVNRQIAIRNAFVKHLQGHPQTGVEVFRLMSSFSGNYYYTKGKELLKDVERPYYMFVIGDKDVLSTLNRKVPFTEIKHGVANYIAYSPYSEAAYTITNKHGAGVTRSNMRSTSEGQSYNCQSKADRDRKCRYNIDIDLSGTLQDMSYINNPKNYKFQNRGVEVESVKEKRGGDGKYSHVIQVSIDTGTKPSGEMLQLKFPRQPEWLESCNDDSGKNIQENLDKTTGIKYIIGGISDAYKDESRLAEAKFVISKK